MQDMVIKGTGNSRFLKSVENFLDLFPTYEAFAVAFASGVLPVDFNGINPDGITQMGTPYAKSAVLTDETAALFGLDSTAVLDDVLRKAGHVVTGSYDGTGTYGAGNPNMLEFDFKPVFIAIVVADEKAEENTQAPYLFVRPWGYNTRYATGNTGGKTVNNYVTWGDNGVSWYSAADANTSTDPDRSSSQTQLNADGVTYHYVAIG